MGFWTSLISTLIGIAFGLVLATYLYDWNCTHRGEIRFWDTIYTCETHAEKVQ